MIKLNQKNVQFNDNTTLYRAPQSSSNWARTNSVIETSAGYIQWGQAVTYYNMGEVLVTLPVTPPANARVAICVSSSLVGGTGFTGGNASPYISYAANFPTSFYIGIDTIGLTGAQLNTNVYLNWVAYVYMNVGSIT